MQLTPPHRDTYTPSRTRVYVIIVRVYRDTTTVKTPHVTPYPPTCVRPYRLTPTTSPGAPGSGWGDRVTLACGCVCDCVCGPHPVSAEDSGELETRQKGDRCGRPIGERRFD